VEVVRDFSQSLLESVFMASIMLLVQYTDHENDPHKNNGAFFSQRAPDLLDNLAISNSQVVVNVVCR
jgi:hypothetical protein